MKKFFISAALLATLASHAQEFHNANWYFGYNAGLSFFPDPSNPTSISTALETLEAPSSYSNAAGQLMFYTNGRDVYNGNHTPMTNGTGLKAHNSSGQGSMIVKKPKNINSTQTMAIGENETLYIVTLDGSSGEKKGFYYSEVDLNVSTGIGTVTNKNVQLNDHENIPIGLNYKVYGNFSEKLTSAPHCNGRDYWIITQIGEFIYSYLVSPNGISTTPTAVSNAPINIQNHLANGGATGQVKVSLKNDRLAVIYYSTGPSGVSSGSLAMANFDSNTGEVIFDNNLIEIPVSPEPSDNGHPWGTLMNGVEFSPDSQQIYFTATYQLFKGDAYNATSANVELVEAINNVPQTRFMTYMQLGMDGKIYVITQDINEVTHIGRINDPNSINNPDFRINDVTLQYGASGAGFPGWIHSQLGGCDASLQLYKPELSPISHEYKVGQVINTNQNYTVGPGKDITLKAGHAIYLFPNTSIQTGSKFLAEIEECDCIATSGSNGSGTQTMRKTISTEELQLYPNPASEYVKISNTQDIIVSVTATAMNGQIVFRGNNDGNDITLDTSAYQKGIYILTIQTKNGKVYNEKLIIK